MSIEDQLIVFDFDWSMADQDTDHWTFEVLAPDLRREMANLEDQTCWVDLVARLLRQAHDRRITREEIEDNLRVMPFDAKHPAMVRGVKTLKQAGKTTFLCLSNANTVFISTILKSKGLENLFTEIITNPAEWDGDLLKVRRWIDPDGPQHKCKVGCEPNICKGEELTAFLERHGKNFGKIVYVGDSSNDFCPILRLRSQDVVYCRRHRGLERLIQREGEKQGLKCQIQYWTGSWEVEEMFRKL